MLAIFMDNVSYHRSKETRSKMNELNIRAIYNVAYRPDLNPIENYFALLKRAYKRERLRKISRSEEYDPTQLVGEFFAHISKESINNIVERAQNLWREIIMSRLQI